MLVTPTTGIEGAAKKRTAAERRSERQAFEAEVLAARAAGVHADDVEDWVWLTAAERLAALGAARGERVDTPAARFWRREGSAYVGDRGRLVFGGMLTAKEMRRLERWYGPAPSPQERAARRRAERRWGT